VPAIGEQLPGFQAQGWFAVFAPLGTLRPIVNRLNQALVAILQTPEFRSYFQENATAAVGNTPEEAARFIEEDTQRWLKVARDAKIEPQ